MPLSIINQFVTIYRLIRTISGKTIYKEINDDASVLDLKQNIQDITGIAAQDQTLVCVKQLRDDSKVFECCSWTLPTIDVSTTLKGGLMVYVYIFFTIYLILL